MINLLKLGRLTSGYGARNTGIPGASKNHMGVDIVLKNTNIPAVVAGTVSAKGWHSKSGNYIEVTDENGLIHRYQHMKSPSGLAVGTKVKEGQTLGIMGNTGVGSGPHLHYEVMKSDRTHMNPLNYLKGGKATYTESGTVQATATDTKKDKTESAGNTTETAATAGSSDGFLTRMVKGASTAIVVCVCIVLCFLFLIKAFDLKI